MTISFMGGEMSAFLPSDSVPIELTGGGTGVFPFDSAFSRCGIQIVGTSYVDTPQFAALTECWTHVSLTHTTSSGAALSYYPLVWLNGSDVEVLRLKHVTTSGAETVSFEHWTGAAWASGSAVSVPLASNMQILDARFVVNSASGTAALYVAGTERINATVDLSAIASIRKVRATGSTAGGFNGTIRFSQLIVATQSTIGYRLGTCYPSAAGATSSWTGAYSDIDETVYSDADFINSAAANQISTFAQTAIPTLSGYVVRAVAVSTRAKRGSSGPQNMRHALRVSGTDYFSGSDIALGLGYTPTQTIWETNPATAAAWVNTAIAAIQPGAKSIT